MTTPRIAWLFLVAALSTLAATARADVRVWSEAASEGNGAPEADPEEPPRYLDLTGYLQPGYIWRQDDDGVAARTDIPITDDQFRIHRARIGVRALPYPWLMFRLELEAVAPVGLRDAWVGFRLDDALRVRLGQFKTPFTRSYLMSSARLGFIDRPLYVPSGPDRGFLSFLPRRDLGVMVHGTVGDTEAGPALEYGVGAFLGGGANRTRDRDGVLLLAARAEGHLFGLPEGDGAETDLAHNHSPKVSVGLAGFTNCDEVQQWNRGFTVDTELRLRGIYASAGFVWSRNGPRDGDFLAGPLNYGADDACGSPEDPAFEGTHVGWGTHVQAQYVLPRLLFPVDGQSLEVAARWDMVRPQAPADGLLGGDEGTGGYVAPESYASPHAAPDQWRLTFGVNWYPTADPSLRLSLDYQHRRETEDVAGPPGEPAIEGLDNDVVWLELTAAL